MKIEELDEYSLWLEPTRDDLERIQSVILEFCNTAGVESFVPHVTLLANITYYPDKIKEQLDKLSENFTEIEVKFNKLSLGDNHLKYLFLECEQNASLIDLNKKAQEIFSTNREFNPHMSFIYGDVDQKLKEGLAKKVLEYDLEYFSFKAQTISLWYALGTPRNWKKLF